MPVLSSETFKAIDDRRTVEVDMSQFEGWGGVTVRLKPMSGTLRSEIEREWIKIPKGEKIMVNHKEQVLSRCIVDADDKVQFDSPEGVLALAAMNGAAIEHLYTVAAKQNGLDSKAVEDAAKNSPAPSEGAS
jgi:hypothetical protein